MNHGLDVRPLSVQHPHRFSVALSLQELSKTVNDRIFGGVPTIVTRLAAHNKSKIFGVHKLFTFVLHMCLA